MKQVNFFPGRRVLGAVLMCALLGMTALLGGCQNPFLLAEPDPAVPETGVEENAASPEEAGDAAPAPETAASAEVPEGSTGGVATVQDLAGFVICLDPGHGITSAGKQEAMSPLSSQTKPAYVSGAVGKFQTEEELNLAVAELLRDKLEAAGAQVLLTRTTHEATVSNIERAEMANEAGADLCVRIHADGSENKSVHGISVLVPAGNLLGTPSIETPSRAAAQSVHDALIAATGAEDHGLVQRTDLTGFNWSEVPVILVEMGFLSNDEEDQKMATAEYRETLAEAMYQGIRDWLLQ